MFGHPPKPILNAPKLILNTPKHGLNSLKLILNAPKRTLSRPKPTLNSPKRILSTPTDILNSPKRSSPNIMSCREVAALTSEVMPTLPPPVLLAIKDVTAAKPE